jgi:hypothetical protein
MHAIIYASDGGREDSPGKEDEVIYKVYTDWNCEEPCHLQTMGSLTGAFICICVCMYVCMYVCLSSQECSDKSI